MITKKWIKKPKFSSSKNDDQLTPYKSINEMLSLNELRTHGYECNAINHPER